MQHLPAEILPSCEEGLAIHLCRLKELVERQWQFDVEALWVSVEAE